MMGRSRRNGSLERLIGMRMLILASVEESEKPGVVGARRDKASTQRLDLAIPICRRALRESAQDQLTGGRAEFILDVGKGRIENRGDFVFAAFFERDAAEQL